LIQGDFLTQTSREGIREHEPWNIKLRDAIPACFAEGLTNMIKNPELAIESIKFIPHSEHSLGNKFLTPVVQQILDTVKGLPIVCTYSGSWVTAARALVVPRPLHFEDNPIFTEREIKFAAMWNRTYEYIDSTYDAKAIAIIKALGCQTLDFEMVFAIISTAAFPFNDKPYAWFAALFQYLNDRMSNTKARVPFYLKLDDNSWTSANRSKKVFFPLTSESGFDQDIPTLGLAMLHDKFYRKVAQTPAAELFLMNTVQVKHLSGTEILRAIIEHHRQTPESALSVDECIKHAAYLTKRQHTIAISERQQLREVLHFVDHKKIIVRGAENIILDCEVSVNGGVTTTLSQMCKSDSSLHFLGNDYPPQVWQFIQSSMGIKLFLPFTKKTVFERFSKKRRLVKEEREAASTVYTEVLAPKRRRDNNLLYYLSDLLHGDRVYEVPLEFRKAIRELPCLCENGSFAILENCFLRTRSLDPLLSTASKMLAVDSPDDPKWEYLKAFGVILQPNLEIHLQLIRRRKSEISYRQEMTTDVFKRIYSDLILFFSGTPDSDASSHLR
jgi:hypothetical protein